jgi:serine/threonine protein kinase/tetratricopeptide (TPR) repeat protein
MKCPRCQSDNPTESLYCSRCGTQLLAPRESPPSFTQTAVFEPPPQELTVGTMFAGRYRVMEELGKGGMGRVYKAFDSEIKEFVALKILNSEITSGEGVIERFRNELKLARRIAHRSVCRMFDLGRSGDTTYITMELVSGEDLKTLLRRVGQLPAKRTVAIAREVAEGLAEAHRLGIIHRDLKPQNIMIDRGGNAHIMDFGIARSVRGGGITGTGVIIGTPDYMSPEQLEGKEADRRSDMYSFGAVLFEMATGETPFEGATPMAVALKHKTEKPRDPHLLNPQIPETLARIILRCLEKEPQRRFQTTDVLLAELAAAESGLPATRGLSGGATKSSRSRFKKGARPAVFALLAGAVAVAAALYFFVLKAHGPGGLPSGKPVVPPAYKSSIAVLPFEDLSPGKDQEAFSSGITDDLITKLSSLGQLKVISRQSVMRYRSADKDIREIGKELGVENILEGSIQREKDNIRVNVKLTRVQDGSNLWGETYDRKVESIFSVQDEISKAVVNALRIELVAGQDYMLVKRYTRNPDAYNLYTQGRLEWNKMTERGLKRSIELYQEAIARDPNFALAYASIADAYNLMADMGVMNSAEAFPKAKEAAEKALKIDDALAEGYSSLAYVKWQYDWDWMGAEIDFNWAIGLNPNYAVAYLLYGNLLKYLGRSDEAVIKLDKARELDPESLVINLAIGDFYRTIRQYDRAIAIWKDLINKKGDSPLARWFLGRAYLGKKAFKKAIKEFETAEKLAGIKGLYTAEIAQTQALAGNASEARSIIGRWLEQSKPRSVSPYSLAIVFGALGDKDQAFGYLEKAFTQKDINPSGIKVEPELDPLRDDPRFDALLEKMNLR